MTNRFMTLAVLLALASPAVAHSTAPRTPTQSAPAQSTPAQSSPAQQAPAQQAPVQQTPATPPAAAAPIPTLEAPRPATVKVSVIAAEGPILLELETERAPITAGNFLHYVDQKRFDGATFYRAVKIPNAPE